MECLCPKDLGFENLLLPTASCVWRSFVLLLKGRRIYGAVLARVDISNGVSPCKKCIFKAVPNGPYPRCAKYLGTIETVKM